MRRKCWDISKEELYDLYIVQNLTPEEIASKVNWKQRIVEKWIGEYNLHKTQEQKTECFKRRCLEKYGVDNPQKLKEVQLKTQQTCLEKYGNACYLASEVGMEKSKNTCLEKYGTTNGGGTEQAKEKIKSTMQAKYGVDWYTQTEDCQLKSHTEEANIRRQKSLEETNLEKYGVKCNWATEEYKKWYHEHSAEFKEKEIETKKKNGTTNYSQPEEDYYILLCEQYGKDDIIRQYKEERYPYYCDFYIESEDKFIELNYHWTHGAHPFDLTNNEDIELLNMWKKKAEENKYKENNFYKTAIHVWTELDPLKFEIAKENNLNYLALYKGDDALWPKK